MAPVWAGSAIATDSCLVTLLGWREDGFLGHLSPPHMRPFPLLPTQSFKVCCWASPIQRESLVGGGGGDFCFFWHRLLSAS